jgi:hypothetical protein
MAKEMIFQRPALTQAWANLKEGDLYVFDVVSDYPKKYHLDKSKDGPIGQDDPPVVYEVEDILYCIGNDTVTAILGKGKDKVLVVLSKDLPYLLIQGKDQIKVPLEKHGKEGVYGIKKLFPDYQLEAVVVNPKIKTLEELGVLKSMVKQALADKDLVEGGKNEPARKPNRKNQGGPEKERLEDGRDPADPHACE